VLVWNRSRPLPELKQTRLTSNSSEIPVLSGAVSPDGKDVAYSDSRGLHLKVLGTAEARTLSWPLGSASGATWNVAGWFPDGTQLLTNLVEPGGRSSTWAVSVVGENPRQLRDDATAQAVSPDGSRIAFTTGAPNYDREIWTMSAQGGDPQRVLEAGENESLANVQWSPEGERIAYAKGRQTRWFGIDHQHERCEGWQTHCSRIRPALVVFLFLVAAWPPRLLAVRFRPSLL